MTESELIKLTYPIGKFEWNENPTIEEINLGISKIETFPGKLKDAVDELTNEQIQSRYRPESWNIAQVIHHLADSHMHSYLRFKHAILEDTPSIKDYHEANWALLPDASNTDLSYSLELLSALHKRWTLFLKSLTHEELKRKYLHPERNKLYPLDTTILIYAWHGDHHLAHIENAKTKGY